MLREGQDIKGFTGIQIFLRGGKEETENKDLVDEEVGYDMLDAYLSPAPCLLKRIKLKL